MRLNRLLAALLSPLLLLGAAQAHAQVVISQVYSGGGMTGSPYDRDFVELFNTGNVPVDITGWSLQQTSSTGQGWTVIPLAGTVPAGGHYLVGLRGSTAAQPALPTADASADISLALSGAKVALVNSATALTGSCPSSLDLVSYGAADCPVAPSAPAGAPSSSTAAIRKGAGCTQTGNPSADFALLPPTPRNTASDTASLSCSGASVPARLKGTGSASRSRLGQGDGIVLTVAVVPATQPASTDITVQIDLSAIGGLAGQALFDDGTQGDVTPADGVFTVATSVAQATSTGLKSLPFLVADGENRTHAGHLELGVVPRVAIHDIQAHEPINPYNWEEVITEGIVTAVRRDGFYIQSAPGEEDARLATSEGIVVLTSEAPPSAAAVGNRVSVIGVVLESVPFNNRHQWKRTVLRFPTVTLLSSGHALPAPGVITAEYSNPDGFYLFLDGYEGMRVSVPGLKVVGPGDGTIDEVNAASSANGLFFGVLEENAWPFREPGIAVYDYFTIPAGVSPPRFDVNPELIGVESLGQVGASLIATDAGATVGALTGVLDYIDGGYRLLTDPGPSPQVVGGQAPTAVSDPASNEVSVASVNLDRFYDDVDDAGSDVVLTTDAFERRLGKTARAICGYVRSPDVLGLAGIENLNALTRLAQTINDSPNSGCHRDTRYVAYLMPGNDPENLNVGFLVRGVPLPTGKTRVQVEQVAQLGKNAVYANSPFGTMRLLNDRPSLMLRAVIHQADGGAYPVTVIANHLHTLTGVNSPDVITYGWPSEGARVRDKRAAQAQYLAEQVQARQAANPGEQIILLGGFNAFEFNDGYVDSMGIVTGREAQVDKVVKYVDSPITVPLTNMTTLAAPEDRYTTVLGGNAQALDHVVVSAALLAAVPGARIEHARINADFGVDNFGDDTVPVRFSGHDPVVLYLPNTSTTADLVMQAQLLAPTQPAGTTVPVYFSITNQGPSNATNVSARVVVNAPGSRITLTQPGVFTCATASSDANQTVFSCEAQELLGSSVVFLAEITTTLANAGETVTLSGEVSSLTPDPVPGNNAFTYSVAIQPPVVDMSLALAAPSTLEGNDQDSTVGFNVRNVGNVASTSPVLDVQVAASNSKVSARAPAGWQCEMTHPAAALTTVRCRLDGSLPPYRTDRIDIDIHSLASTRVQVSGTVSSPVQPDTNAANDSATSEFMVMQRKTSAKH